MLLYLWINKFKHIFQTGINLSSEYKFDFITENTNDLSGNVSGKLQCTKLSPLNIFNKNITNVKAIIGENGAGKSTVLQALINNIMTTHQFNFDGFLVTDKFIFNRKNISFSNIDTSNCDLNLTVLSNIDLINYDRNEYQIVKQANEHGGLDGQIASKYLNNQSIVHYSPLLNTDRIENIEGVAGSSKIWETNYWHYYDYGLENCIVKDYRELSIGEDQYYMTGESEILAHKTAEARRMLLFLASFDNTLLPFDNKIETASFSFNDFYEKYWDSIDENFKQNNQSQGIIAFLLNRLDQTVTGTKPGQDQLEALIYKAYLFGALKYEYKHKSNFSREDDSTSLADTLSIFQKSIDVSESYKSALENFLNHASFSKGHNHVLFDHIKNIILHIMTNEQISNRSSYGFDINISATSSVKDLINLICTSPDENGKIIPIVFNVFSISFQGLSSGEKSILSMFGRFKEASDSMPSAQNEVVLLLDEPEVALHPQWQTLFIDTLNTCLPIIFPKKRIQLIITSHSPIIISDIPTSNIVFLSKEEKSGRCLVSNIYGIDNTFAANIHTLFANAFFLKEKGGSIGRLAKSTINDVISLIKSNETKPLNSQQVNFCKKVIDSIGEPLLRDQLHRLFYDHFPDQKVTNLNARIEYLQKALDEALLIRNNENRRQDF